MNTENMSQQKAIEQEEMRVNFKKKYGDEQILVIPHQVIDDMNFKQGITTMISEYEIGQWLKDARYCDRWRMEINPNFRQPIPYIVVVQDGKVFGMKRLAGAGEQRLHGLISLGAGGHINPCDGDIAVDGEMIYYNSIIRELDEELIITIPEENQNENGTLYFEGVINDTSNEVGKDHIGLIYVAKLKQGNTVVVNETDKYEGAFYTIDELKENPEALENWSALVLDAIVEGEINID